MKKKHILGILLALLLVVCQVFLPVLGMQKETGKVLADVTAAPTATATATVTPSATPTATVTPTPSPSVSPSASPSASATPTPAPDTDTRTPVSISAVCLRSSIPINTLLLREDFSVTASYENGETHDLYGFEFSPEKLLTTGKQYITISYTINSTKRTCSCTVVGEVTDASSGYTVKFNSNGGSSVSEIKDIVANSTIWLPVSTKKGYWFRGWYKESSLKTRFTDTDRVNANMTLYAKWEKKDKTDKNTMYTLVSDGAVTLQAQIDLTDQNYGPDVRPDIQFLDKSTVKKAVEAIAKTDKYYALDFSIPDLYYNSAIPVPVVMSIPEDINMSCFGIYLTTNRTSVMGQIPLETASEGALTIKDSCVVSGRTVKFYAYQDGVYLITQNVDDEDAVKESQANNPAIRVSAPKERLNIGQSFQLSHELLNLPNKEALEKSVKWKSSNTKCAVVTDMGMVSGLSIGSVTITCYIPDTSLSDSVEFRVTTDGTLITKMKPVDKKLKLFVGETEKVNVLVRPTNAANKKFTYKSTKTKIAKVNKRGVVKAVAPGKCRIKIKSTDGSFESASVQIVVKKAGKVL